MKKHWLSVYYYFTKWRRDGTIEEVHEHLREHSRKLAGRDACPSLGLIDSQSVKTTRSGGLPIGIDGGKKTKGRKRHIVVGAMGLLMTVFVHAANTDAMSMRISQRYEKVALRQ